MTDGIAGVNSQHRNALVIMLYKLSSENVQIFYANI